MNAARLHEYHQALKLDQVDEPKATGPFDVVVKGGADGAVTVVNGVVMEHAAMLTDVVDLTGAGDALAAGYLVGGIQLGLAAAARCVSQHGAQPTDPAPRAGRHRSGQSPE